MIAKLVKYTLLLAAAASVTSCATRGQHAASTPASADTATPGSSSLVIGGAPRIGSQTGPGVTALPHAVIYKTNGDYDNNVTITLNDSGQAPVSYPGPGDVGTQSTPLRLADGWLLDRRGSIGPKTVFLSYTYDEYHALPQVPAVSTLMSKIIPGARVEEAYRLPMTANAALADTSAVNNLIREGLPGATPLVEVFRLQVK